jgi:Holliday junction resolvasome RuvABC endonuclease subunit
VAGSILALDLATVSGWAAGPPGSVPVSGSLRIGRKGSSLIRFLDAADVWLHDIIAVHRPTLLVIEAAFISPHRTSRDVAARLTTLSGLAQLQAFRAGLDESAICEASSTEVAKFFTGHGRLGNSDEKKELVMRRCKALGWEPADYDEADALALWRFAEAMLFPGARREVLALEP